MENESCLNRIIAKSESQNATVTERKIALYIKENLEKVLHCNLLELAELIGVSDASMALSVSYTHLVVDLRNNGGGSDGVIWPLLRVLRQAMDRGMEGVEPLEPDVTVPQTMADTLAGRDTAVEWFLPALRWARESGAASGTGAVSYTHLDVYKRQSRCPRCEYTRC